MSSKLRVLRILAIVLGILGFVGYFAFTTFFFNPLEGKYALDVSGLVPRNADFFLARARLNELFDGFPKLADEKLLAEVPAWKSFRASPEYDELDARLGLRASLESLQQSLEGLPVSVRLERVFGGEDLALAGYFRAGGLERAAWAIYGRASWLGKLGYSLLSHPGWIGLESQGLSVASEDEVLQLSGGQLLQPLSLTRVRDVVIVSNDADLAKKAKELAAEGGTESFFNSARYHDHIRNAERGAKRDELELFCDVRKLLESLGQVGQLPDIGSDNLAVAFLGRVFQAPACKEVIGVLGLHEGLTLRLHVDLSSEQVTRFQERLYRTRGATRDEILAAARYAPADTAYFLLGKGPTGEILTELLASAEPAVRSNLDDLFRQSKRYAGVDEVIKTLDASVEDQFSIIVRSNDYEPEYDSDPNTGEKVYVGPPNDGAPVFAVSLVNRMRDAAKIEQFRSHLRDMGKELGLQGRTPGSPGVFTYGVMGLTTMEFWNALVPGTGVISSLLDPPAAVTSNCILMPVQLWRTEAAGRPTHPRLTDRSEFNVLLDDLLAGASANLVFWCDPSKASPTLREQAEVHARDQAAAGIDWNRLRAREQARLLEELYPGRAREDLAPNDGELLDREVDEALRSLRESEAGGLLPGIRAAKMREISYWEAVRALMVVVRFDERRMEIALRAIVPLGSEP